MLKKGSFILFLFFLSGLVYSQEIQIKSGFSSSEMTVGEEVVFWIKTNASANIEIEFPDSTSSFSPFEFVKKTFIPTRVVGQNATDSVAFTLQSFEIDAIQTLKLPIKIRKGNKSYELFTERDSINLRELAPNASDTTSLKSNVNYSEVQTAFNYPLLYIILGGIVLLLIIFFLVFGKKIKKWLKIRSLNKRKKIFDEKFQNFISSLKEKPELHIAEGAIKLWKNYQEKIENIPYSKLTTTEILELENTKELEKPLRAVDRLIYGKKENYHIYQDFEQISNFANYRFNNKIENIKNG